MKSNTSDASPKRRGRPPKKVEPKEIITDEDKALDVELDKMLAEAEPLQPMPKLDGYDGDAGEVITKEMPKGDHLNGHVEDYKPASNYYELEQQVAFAKECGCNTIEVTDEFFKKHFRQHYQAAKDGAGYIQYKDIMTHIEGMVDHARHVNSRTMYSRG